MVGEMIAAARNTMIKCTREQAQMRQELSGCDWCCGGGDEKMAELRQVYEVARQVLVEAGVKFDPEKTICRDCMFHDRVHGTSYCELCLKME